MGLVPVPPLPAAGGLTMRVAVIAPPYPLSEAPAPPLGVTYVAAAFAAAGAEVRIFDFIVSRYHREKLAALLEDFRPDVVGATSVTLNYPRAAAILDEVKELSPRTLTVMGGPHASFDAPAVLSDHRGIDVVVMGEGEETVRELMASSFDPRFFPRIDGIAYRQDGGVIVNPPRGFIADIDSIPTPARHLLPLSRYRALGFPISVITGRGCPYRCIFCQGRRMVGGRMRKRKVSSVMEEIEEILSYGIDRINVADDLFVSDRERVREVCDEIRRRGLRFAWSAFARVNTVDLETLERMREAGCDSISFGVESANRGILRTIRKGITPEEVVRAVEMARAAGLLVHCSFIVGLPGETRETLAETASFAASLGCYYGYHHLAPFPGTTVREEAATYDLEILTDDWTLYDANRAVVRTSALSPEDLDAFVAAFEGEIEKEWNKLLDGYRAGTNSPGDDLRVEGHFRTQLTYRLLADDLLEEHGTVPRGRDGGREALFRAVAALTGHDPGLVARTLGDFIARGYIKGREEGDAVRWYWTHNNRLDSFPL
ncbi:MAG TPA: radical SAM protein [Syntrophales bacterium]|nr:radical SAM protein [Syntrophales bacterium]HPQ06755.1 radical SAM protein [Syntrophales bacterium]